MSEPEETQPPKLPPLDSNGAATGAPSNEIPLAAEVSVSPSSVEGLFLQALQLTSPADREAFLDRNCKNEPDNRRRVTALLRAHADAGDFMESPVVNRAAMSDSALNGSLTDQVSLDFLKPSDKEGQLGTIGPYEVLEEIGRGGMGVVLRAIDPKLNRIVAVKALLPELASNPNSRRRFLREAQAAAAISHPHVVAIHAVDDSDQDHGGTPVPPFLIMECIVGQSLQQKLDKVGPLRLTEILRISRQISDGLAAAHKQGLVHRDIKPANILLENGVERVKITDFGLARAIDDITVTRTGEVCGTPQYMSPEQACGERVDHRSDLFSLGCVIYAMCTGHSPFRGDSIAHVIKRVTQDEPRSIADQNPEIPSWLIEIIRSLLQKNAEHRFQSADALAEILDQHLSRIQHPTESGSHSLINQQLPTTVDRNAAQPASTATQPAAAVSSLSTAGLLGPSGKVLVPSWMRSLSRIWLMLALAIFVLLSVVQRLPNVRVGSAELMLVFSIGAMGSIFMAGILLRRIITPQLMAMALFLGLGPFGLLVYLLIKEGLQPAPVNETDNDQPESTRKSIATTVNGTLPKGTYLHALIFISPAIVSGLMAIYLQAGPAMSSDLAATAVELLHYPMIFTGMWLLQLLGNKLYHGNKFSLRSYALMSGAVLASMAIGWFWSVLLRMPTSEPQQRMLWRSVLGFASIPTLVWILYCLYVGRELAATKYPPRAVSEIPQASPERPAPTPFPPRRSHWQHWLIAFAAFFLLMPIVLTIMWAITSSPFQAASTFDKPRTSEFQKMGIPDSLVPSDSTASESTIIMHYERGMMPEVVVVGNLALQPDVHDEISIVKCPLEGEHEVIVSVYVPNGGYGRNLTVSRTLQLSRHKPARFHLSRPVNADDGGTIGTENPNYGGLILETPDPGTEVLLISHGPHFIGFLPRLLGPGEHKVPIGNYSLVIVDSQSGWLADVKSSHASEFTQSFDTLDRLFGRGSPEMSRLHDKVSGTWAATIYSADIAPFEIKTGEFTTVTARRSLPRIMLSGQSTEDGGSLHFEPSQNHRFQWNGRKYSLTDSQAVIVNTLLQALGTDSKEVFEADLIKAIAKNKKYFDASTADPAHSIESHFNDGKHPAWTELLTITGTAPERKFELKELR